MAKGGGSGNVTSTQSSAPWAGAQPYITDYLSRAQTQSNQPFNFYSGDQVAGFSPEQQLGMQQTTNRALAGSPTLNAGNNYATSVLNGDYLDPSKNPYLQSTVNQSLGDVQSRVQSLFNNNNFGSSANQEQLTRQLGDQANNLYGANYANERGIQNQVLGQAPSLAAADYIDPSALQSVGAQRQGLAQQYLTQAGNTYQNAVNYPQQQLDNYGRALGAGSGSQSTSTGPNPNQQSGLANILGTGLSAAGLFGGGLGGLGGLFGGAGAAGGLGGITDLAMPALWAGI